MPSAGKPSVAYRIEFDSQALRDLEAINDYIAYSADEATADAYTSRIERACKGLADFPNRGTPHDDLHPGLRSISFERRATIFYEVQGIVVTVLEVAYAGRVPSLSAR